MAYETDLLVALKDWGLPVIECNGWKTRGSSTFNPKGSVNHHTAGSTSGSIPSLSLLVNGRSDLPGPLCNVAQSRSSNFDGAAKYDNVYLVAAGRANHAGLGGWQGLSGNSSVFGLEIEHCGYLDREDFSERRAHTAYRIHRAFMDVGGFDAGMVCQHKEWAPTRKIDFVGADGAAFRTAVAAVSNTAPAPAPAPTPDPDIIEEEEHDMELPALIVKSDDPNHPHWYVTDGITRQHIPNRTYAGLLINQGKASAQSGTGDMARTSEIVPFTWPRVAVDAIRLVGKAPV